MKLPAILLSAHCLFILRLPAEVHSWRNGGNGLYPDVSVPLHWDSEDAVLWKIRTPDWANACPILVGDRLFYTVEPAFLVCADAATGKTLWTRSNAYEDVYEMPEAERQNLKKKLNGDQDAATALQEAKRKVYNLTRRLRNDESNNRLRDELEQAQNHLAELEEAAGAIPEKFIRPRTHNTNGHASMTPCSDGEFIYTCNNLGIVTKHDLQGNRIWARVMERPDHNWGAAVSPQLIGGKLIVRIADYAALDPETGEELWRVKDPHTFGPPAAFAVEGEWFLYTVRGELIRVSDGRKLPSQDWTIEQKSFAFFNTPFVSGNRVYVVHGAAGIQGDVYRMEIPETLEELNREGLKQIWHTVASKERYYTSPIEHEGLVYIMSMGCKFQALDAATGEIVYSHKVEGMRGRAFTGILLVNSLLFTGEEDGVCVFIQPGPEYREVVRFNLGENRGTPIFAGDTAYWRTMEHLFAFRRD